MDGSQEELNLGEFNIIDNIIESAVDELLLKRSSAHCDYSAIAGLLLPLCRLCAREDTQMMHISDVHVQIIGDLRIPGINGTSLCTNICRSCNGFLEEFCKFRSLCEEGQKRIFAVLAERNVLPDFLKLDFAKKGFLSHAAGPCPTTPDAMAMPEVACSVHMSADLENKCFNESGVKGVSETGVRTPPVNPWVLLKTPPRRASKIARELVRTLAPNESSLDESSDAPYGSPEPVPTDESDVRRSLTPDQTWSSSAPGKRLRYKATTGAIKPAIKEPKKEESRRRIVNGCFQWVCLDCEQVFRSSLQLKKHRRVCELVGSKASKRFATLICDMCGERWPTEAALKVHRQHKHPATGDVVGGKEIDTSPEVLVCHVCGRTCKSNRALRVHLITHDSSRQVECHICGKRFQRRRTLRIHMDVHSGKKHECDVCGKQFLTVVTLRNHAKTHRDDYLRHECTMCPRRFTHPRQLQRHMMNHTGVYPHECEICNITFRTLGRYNRHMQKGHVLPEGLNMTEQGELQNSDDLIEYEPELEVCEMLQNIPEESTQSVSLGSVSLPEEVGFVSDQVLHEASQEFTMQCFTDASDVDDPFYSFIDC